jgi:ankyrin repeat protein
MAQKMKQKRPLQSQKPNLIAHKEAVERKPTLEELNTELLIAVLRDDTNKVKNLLAAGADINKKDDEGKPLLLWAASGDFFDMCALLLERGAKINAVDNNGETALMHAAEKGHAKICELLLEKGAKINARNEVLGETALMYAAWVGHARVCEILLMHKASIRAKDYDRRTVLKIAEQGGDEETIALLRTVSLLGVESGRGFLSYFRLCVQGVS